MAAMKALVFASYEGLSVKDVTELRAHLRKENIDLLVAKKTLLRKSLTLAGFDPSIVDQIQGSVAMAFGYTDEVTPAKVLQKFSKDHDVVKFKGGIIQGQFLNAAQVKSLAALPSREELLAKTVWVLNSPVTGLVNVLAGNIRSLITILQALKDKQPAVAG